MWNNTLSQTFLNIGRRLHYSMYINELFLPSTNIYKTRSHMALEIPLRKSNLGQKSISFMGPSIWNKLSNDLKILNTATFFTLNYKKLDLQKLE